MQGNTGCGVWADPAYRSEEMEAKLHTRGLKSRIHRKGSNWIFGGDLGPVLLIDVMQFPPEMRVKHDLFTRLA